jgi:hypothetical protein
MAAPGQPTLYKPEYCELGHNYCLLGATNEVLAGFFDVAPRTVDNGIATPSRLRRGVSRPRHGRCRGRPRPVRAGQRLQPPGHPHHAGNQGKKIRKDRLLLRFEKALLPVTVILEPCNGTQKFALLRAEPTGRERCGESMHHAGD